jgi:hypothetical protein
MTFARTLSTRCAIADVGRMAFSGSYDKELGSASRRLCTPSHHATVLTGESRRVFRREGCFYHDIVGPDRQETMPRPESVLSNASAADGGDHWQSVARASYVQHHASRTLSMSPSRREVEKVKERLATGPKFVAASNYDVSFRGAEGGRASPLCRPDDRSTPVLPFVETSTSRASYQGGTDKFPERVRGHSPQVRKPLAFKATSISRQTYVDHHRRQVPPRAKEEHRPLPHVKFDAISTATASYVAPSQTR